MADMALDMVLTRIKHDIICCGQRFSLGALVVHLKEQAPKCRRCTFGAWFLTANSNTREYRECVRCGNKQYR